MTEYVLVVKRAFRGQRDLRDVVAAVKGVRLMQYFHDTALIETTEEEVARLAALAGEWLAIDRDARYDPWAAL